MERKGLYDLAAPEAAIRNIRLKEADFIASKEFRFSWIIRQGELTFKLSDYLDTAPESVIGDFCGSAFDHISGKRNVYADSFSQWIRSEEFIHEKRPIYIRRSKNISRSHVGRCKDLMESADRLLASGLLIPSDIDDSYITWTSRPNVRRVGYCSPMMRVAVISNALDSNDVPDYVTDYVVYHECLHLRQGYRPFKRSHDRQFRLMESEYPDMARAEAFLRRIKG